ncbi:MAG: hypothetical protein WBB07_29710 [Mycobacterium sp.]
MAQKFTGEIALDIRESKPDWNAFLDRKAPRGSAQRSGDPVRRHRLCRLVNLRRADTDAHPGPLAAEHPDTVRRLTDLWLAEAEKNNVLPLNDYGVEGIHALECKVAPPADGRYLYYSNTSKIPEASGARTLGSSLKIVADVDFTTRTQGVIVSQGSRFGGYTLFAKDVLLQFVYNFLGIAPEQRLSCPVRPREHTSSASPSTSPP